MLLNKRERKPGLKFNPGLGLIGFQTTGPRLLITSEGVCVEKSLSLRSCDENLYYWIFSSRPICLGAHVIWKVRSSSVMSRNKLSVQAWDKATGEISTRKRAKRRKEHRYWFMLPVLPVLPLLAATGSSVYLSCTVPQMIPKMDRKWSSTASDPQSRPQMIPWKLEEWNGFYGTDYKKGLIIKKKPFSLAYISGQFIQGEKNRNNLKRILSTVYFVLCQLLQFSFKNVPSLGRTLHRKNSTILTRRIATCLQLMNMLRIVILTLNMCIHLLCLCWRQLPGN